eukprot:1734699-Pleurochrysis_carterae.AAC.1
MFRAVRPLVRNELGTEPRLVEPLPCLLPIFEKMTSVQRGFPITRVTEGVRRSFVEGASIELLLNRPVMPMRESKLRQLYRLKMQRQTAVSAFLRLEETLPSKGLGATRLKIKK